MAIRATETVETYVCLDGNGKQLAGDVANHTLLWRKDGVSAPATNAPTAVAGGLYQLVIAAAEADCKTGVIHGTSSTPDAEIVPKTVEFQDNTIAAAIAAKVAGFVSGPVAAVSPVADNLDVTIVQGDDYAVADGRTLQWSNPSNSWAGGNLSGAAVNLVVRRSDGAIVLTVAGTLASVGEPAVQTATVALTAAQTALFTGLGCIYEYRLVITKSGRTETEVRGAWTVEAGP